MEKRIRRLGSDEAARAVDFVRAFKGDLARFLDDPSHYLLVAECGGEAAGFLVAHALERPDRDARQMFVYEVAVAPAWRGRGLAAALIREVKALARREGMFEAFVLTSRGNRAARRLYESTGGVVEDDSAMLFVFPLEGPGTV